MDAFCSNFAYDLFISYATVDNKPRIPGDDQTRWVSVLKGMLQDRVDERLGRSGLTKIWMDERNLAGNADIPAEIHEAVKRTAIMVCIVSNGYFTSPWCKQERESFVEACGGNTEGRLILVRRDDIPYTDDRWPKAFSKYRGYLFYGEDPRSGLVRIFGEPKVDAKDDEFFVELERVRTDIAKTMNALKEGRQVRASAEAATTTTTPVVGAESSGSSNGQESTAIYLGETTPDLHDARERVRGHLEQRGYEVLPVGILNRAPDDFKKEAKCDLAKASLFVRLFGPYCSTSIPGLLEGGYEGVEATIAEELDKPVVSWRAADLEEAKILDGLHRKRVFGPDVVAGTIEEFKLILEDQITAQLARDSVKDGAEGERYVLLRSYQGDEEFAYDVADYLADREIGYRIVDEDVSLKDAAAGDERYNGLMVLYGRASREWVEERVQECRQVALKLKDKAPLCAVCKDVSPKDRLRTRPPRFAVFAKEEREDFEEYLRKISAVSLAG